MEEDKSFIKKLVTPDVEDRKEIRTKFNDAAYFIIIGLISLLTIVLPPLFMGCLSSDIGLAFPKNAAGWILWSVLNISTAIANISLLVLFKLQAKKNARNNENFKRANEILNKLAGQKEVFIPRSPRRMDAGDYSKKVVCILISTFTSSIVLTSLILSFDWMTLLSCLVSIIITLCISWVTMLNNEIYWTEEYILYAELKEKEMLKKKAEEEALKVQEQEAQQEQEEEQNVEVREQGIPQSTGTSIGELEGHPRP